MHLDLAHLTYTGPALDDPEILDRLPEELSAALRATDVPFAEDAFGDQFLLREGRVLRLIGELGEVSEAADSLEGFFGGLWSDAEQVLDYQPLLRFREAGGELRPGQLLAAYPPFVLAGEGSKRDVCAPWMLSSVAASSGTSPVNSTDCRKAPRFA
jgi:hypothetical protein